LLIKRDQSRTDGDPNPVDGHRETGSCWDKGLLCEPVGHRDGVRRTHPHGCDDLQCGREYGLGHTLSDTLRTSDDDLQRRVEC